MTDLEDDLQRMLGTRAAEVDPHLTGAGIRSLAAERRQHRAVARPAAGAVLAAALLITPFVLIHKSDSPQRPGPVIVPAGSQQPVPGSSTPTPGSARPSPSVTRPPVGTPSAPSVQLTPPPGSSTPSSQTMMPAPSASATTSRVLAPAPTSPVPSR